jgi:hypothetical protein
MACRRVAQENAWCHRILQRDNVIKQALPVFLAPRIMALKKWHKELVAGVENFADCFYVGFHLGLQLVKEFFQLRVY